MNRQLITFLEPYLIRRDMGGERKGACQEQLSWGSSLNLASDRPSLAIRALLLASKMTSGLLLKLSV